MEANDEKQENVKEDSDQGKEKAAQGKKKNFARKTIGTLWDNIKGAFRGSAKDIFILKAKLIIYAIIAVFVFFALIVESDAEDTSSSSSAIMDSVFYTNTGTNSITSNGTIGSTSGGTTGNSGGGTSSGTTNGNTSGTTGNTNGNTTGGITNGTTQGSTESAELYKATGSLLLATSEQLQAIETNYLTEQKNSREGYYEALNTIYSGKQSSTIANKITHISTNAEEGNSTEIDRIMETASKASGAVYPSDERTIYAHIIRSEKYNFNNIIWRSFVKSGNGLKSENITFLVDEKSKLKYPAYDSGASNFLELDLNFFISKVRPYLQSWYIPFDMIIGTQDAQTGSSLNTDLAYEIITSAYHEIVFDRYKVENLSRATNYLIYDKTTTTTTITRTCADYQYEEDGEYVLTTYCTDSKTEVSVEEKNIREALVNNKEDTDFLSYKWTYVISMAKMFDKVISNSYNFEAYYNYPLDNYNSFINKTGTYASMTVEEFREAEKTNSKADSFATSEEDYNNTETSTILDTAAWTEENVVESIPDEAVKLEGTESVEVVKEIVKVTKKGKEYTDEYSWSDTLKFDESKSGKYNLDSVKDVTGDDLTADDKEYYDGIVDEQELNLVDLMNSDNEIYEGYLDSEYRNEDTTNIGISKSELDISYNVLKKDLTELTEKYPISGLMYGNSLDILEGLNLASIVAAGSINEAILNLALSFEGNYLADMMAVDDIGIFWKDEWCAMFVSYCLRKVEKETGITIPIPNYYSCTTGCWSKYHEKPGFYDVQEWVEANPTAEYRNTNPANIAPLASIQPGDIVLFNWVNGGAGNRDHTAIVKSVEKDESGNVIGITTVDGNIGGNGRGFSYSKVTVWEHTKSQKTSYDLRSIASFISVSTVLDEAEKGNIW